MDLLLYHEFFHFMVDIAATTVEYTHHFQKPFYVPYHKNVYLKEREEKCHDKPLEEALANAFAFNKVKNCSVKKRRKSSEEFYETTT